MHPFRTRIFDHIVTEFLPPRSGKGDRALIVCDGLPSMPSKQRVLEYWTRRGFFVFHPRYKGAWESGGRFLDHDPTQDILEVVRALKQGISLSFFDTEMTFTASEVVVLGASFGGAVALLSSLHPDVDRSVAISPVVDWTEEQQSTTQSLTEFRAYIRMYFGEAYRFSDSDFDRLGIDTQFFNPIAHLSEYDPKKVFIIHAKDDMIVSYQAVERFLAEVACERQIVARGGHFSARISTEFFRGRRIRKFILER
jgi:pimeloyl-ACP methyl ester carboxylesterase